MKKNLILMMAMMLSSLAFSQVGINTTNPASTLDVTAKNATGKASGVDGLLVPRVDRERAQNMANVPTSTLIYVNSIATGDQVGIAANINAVGYYYFDGTVWAKLNPNSGSNVNIYNSDGTLQGNRIVTQNDKTLAFTGTATNVFSVDGNTFSVDAANDRVGIGTIAPQNKLDLGTSHGGNSTTDVTGKKLAVYNAADGSDFYGLGINSGTLQFHAASTKTEAPGMILNSTGNVGIGTDAPSSSAILELNNTSKGFLTTRMTTAQRDAITPKPEGLMIYNLDVHCLQYWNATQWIGNCSNNNNGVATITDCSSGTLNGTYQQGVAMNSTNTKVLTVNVTQIGAWSLSSNTVNGVSWSGSGTFTTTGSQTITVTASGTPTASGSFSYIYNLGGNTCTGSITFVSSGGVAAITNCSSIPAQGTYQVGTAMNSGNTKILIVNVTQLGPWTASSNTVNGISFSGSGNFTSTGNVAISLTASGTPTNSGTFSYIYTLGSSTCTNDITFASGGGVATITDCSSTAAEGTYQVGTAMNSSNRIIVKFNVTQTGPWSLTSNTVNGVTFSGSGTFDHTGAFDVYLYASGTPTAAGTSTYNFNYGGSTCSRNITFASSGGVATITDCTTGALNGTYKQGTAMNGTNEWFPITVNVTQLGAYSITSNTVNGVTWSYSGTFTSLGVQTAYARASGTPTAAGTFSYTFNLGGSTCSRNITFASSTGVATITNCTSGALNGTYQQGTAMNSTNTKVLTVNVTQIGAWSLSSNTVNGVSWSGSGTFTTTGSQTITVTASGTPTTSGSFNYTLNLGGSTCQRSITFASSGINACTKTTLGRSDFPNTYSINGTSVYVSVSGGGVGSALTMCGGHADANSWNLGTITFTFSKPVTGVKFNATFANSSNQTMTVTATNGGTSVSPSLSSNQSCNQVDTVSGSNVKASGTFTVGATVTSITMTRTSGNGGSIFLNSILCGATAQ